jgi:hypothetical protein
MYFCSDSNLSLIVLQTQETNNICTSKNSNYACFRSYGPLLSIKSETEWTLYVRHIPVGHSDQQLNLGHEQESHPSSFSRNSSQMTESYSSSKIHFTDSMSILRIRSTLPIFSNLIEWSSSIPFGKRFSESGKSKRKQLSTFRTFFKQREFLHFNKQSQLSDIHTQSIIFTHILYEWERMRWTCSKRVQNYVIKTDWWNHESETKLLMKHFLSSRNHINESEMITKAVPASDALDHRICQRDLHECQDFTEIYLPIIWRFRYMILPYHIQSPHREHIINIEKYIYKIIKLVHVKGDFLKSHPSPNSMRSHNQTIK